jgi:glycosyl transferase, family 25
MGQLGKAAVVEGENLRFLHVSAVHPHWRSVLLLSTEDDTLVHEEHGTRGTYRLSCGTLHVDWRRFPPEDFVEVDGVYVHESLIGQSTRPTLDQATSLGETAGLAQASPIKVISLRRTPDRREKFARLNDGISFEFVDAVDGQAVDRAKFLDGRLAEEDLPYSAGAIGCALSHLALWERSIKEQAVLTVVEDDAILRCDFGEKSLEVIAGLPAGWDLIMWGWNFDSVLSIQAMPGISNTVIVCNQNQLRQSVIRFRTLASPIHIFRLDKCFGTCAYSISPEGSLKFKQGCFPLRSEPVYFPLLNRTYQNHGIDIAMNNLYPAANCYVSFPPLAITLNLNVESLTLKP